MCSSDSMARSIDAPWLDLLHRDQLVGLTILLFVLCVAVRIVRAHRRHYKYIEQFGGPYDPLYSWILVKVAVKALRRGLGGGSFFSSLFYSLIDLTTQFQAHCAVYSGLEPNVAVYRADELEAVMTHSENIAKPFIMYEMIRPWLKQGLLTSTGSKWRRRRKMLTPAFHLKILDKFAVIINKHASAFCTTLVERTTDSEANVIPFVENLTLNVICETVMGVNLAVYDKAKTTSYLAAIKRIGQLLLFRTMIPYQWPDWFYALTPSGREMYRMIARAHSFTESVIQERRQSFEAEPERLRQLLSMSEGDVFLCKKPFMDLLLKEHFKQPEAFTIQDIREEVDTFMFEGHDTTAMALSFALFLLGHHDDVQERIFDELRLVLGTDDAERELGMDDVRQLKYLDCVVKECLRLYPSVPVVGRRVTQDYQINGKTAPSGSNVYCCFYQLHRDPKYFPDPERFQPERFLPHNAVGRHPYAYLPFSAGPRNCIGQKFAMLEEKIIIAWIVRRFRLRSLIPRDELKLYTEMVLRSVDGLPVQCIPR